MKGGGPRFRPGGRSPFVSAKGPKTMFALSCPFGFPARFTDSGGCATRFVQTVFSMIPESAALLGNAKRRGKILNGI